MSDTVNIDISKVFSGQPSWKKDGRKCPHCGSDDTYFLAIF